MGGNGRLCLVDRERERERESARGAWLNPPTPPLERSTPLACHAIQSIIILPRWIQSSYTNRIDDSNKKKKRREPVPSCIWHHVGSIYRVLSLSLSRRGKYTTGYQKETRGNKKEKGTLPTTEALDQKSFINRIARHKEPQTVMFEANSAPRARPTA